MRAGYVMSSHLIPCLSNSNSKGLCFLHLLCTFFICRHISKISMHICRSTRCPTFHEKNNVKNLKIWSPGGSKISNFQKIQRFELWKPYLVNENFHIFSKCVS